MRLFCGSRGEAKSARVSERHAKIFAGVSRLNCRSRICSPAFDEPSLFGCGCSEGDDVPFLLLFCFCLCWCTLAVTV